MTLTDILCEIHRNRYEINVYKHLSEYILTDNATLKNDNAELNMRLKAIKKINAQENNAIDVLCERGKEV